MLCACRQQVLLTNVLHYSLRVVQVGASTRFKYVISNAYCQFFGLFWVKIQFSCLKIKFVKNFNQNKIRTIFVTFEAWLCSDFCANDTLINAQMWILAATQRSGVRWSREVHISELTPTFAERGSCHKWWQIDWGEWNRSNLLKPSASIRQLLCEQHFVLKLLRQKYFTVVCFQMKESVSCYYACL